MNQVKVCRSSIEPPCNACLISSGRAQLSNPAMLHNRSHAATNNTLVAGDAATPSNGSTFWNTSLALLSKTTTPVTVDVGVWPLAF